MLAEPSDESYQSVWDDAYLAQHEAHLDPFAVQDNRCASPSSVASEDEGQPSSTLVRLPDGDLHVCTNLCPYAEPTLDAFGHKTGECTCPHSGRVIRQALEPRTDRSTGRSMTQAANVDGSTAVNETFQVRWRVDHRRASARAYLASASLVDADVEWRRPEDEKPCARPSKAPSSARGVRCAPKLSTLHAQAADVLTRLLTVAGAGAARAARPAGPPSLPQGRAPPQSCGVPRHLFRKAFERALRHYVTTSITLGATPSMDVISNIALAVHRTLAQQVGRRCEHTRALQYPLFRSRVASLVVTLWTCALQTPYMRERPCGTESFRSFCVGVVYALKRGVALPEAHDVLVPRIDRFETMLLSHRIAPSNRKLRALHSSSHRGLCTLHRCIASLETSELRRVFDAAYRAARDLDGACAQNAPSTWATRP
jgi:hypothetical protein